MLAFGWMVERDPSYREALRRLIAGRQGQEASAALMRSPLCLQLTMLYPRCGPRRCTPPAHAVLGRAVEAVL